MYKEEKNVNNISRKELLDILFDLLRKHNITLSTAESCTGGLIAGAITSLAGISSYYKEGFVTYANEAKNKHLNVPEHILENHGAVSHQTAFYMVRGLVKNTGADVGVAVTGIAGPGGGSQEKPVGLVYISTCAKDDVTVTKNIFSGDRENVRNMTVDMALKLLIEKIEEKF
ncbi:MAG: CinA family protein [Ruminococcaceae bacterium]|nr:CinA family protein [Oscillospiraceae bacterium]